MVAAGLDREGRTVYVGDEIRLRDGRTGVLRQVAGGLAIELDGDRMLRVDERQIELVSRGARVMDQGECSGERIAESGEPGSEGKRGGCRR